MRKGISATLLLLVAACSGPPSAAPQRSETQSFTGAGRDRLCIATQGYAQRAGLIVYGGGDSNCSAAGRLVGAGAQAQLVPNGEGACRIGLSVVGAMATVSAVPAACAYYCAPGASLAGKRFTRDAQASNVTDLAGDPLC